jgi:hypothetical protein
MAAIMECPSCKRMLKEEGDEMKSHKYCYRVNDFLGRFRTIECTVCGFIASSEEWD